MANTAQPSQYPVSPLAASRPYLASSNDYLTQVVCNEHVSPLPGMWRSLHGLASAPTQPTPSSQNHEERHKDAAAQASASQAQQTRDASTLESLGKVSAEACDQMIGNLKQAKSKVFTFHTPPPSSRRRYICSKKLKHGLWWGCQADLGNCWWLAQASSIPRLEEPL